MAVILNFLTQIKMYLEYFICISSHVNAVSHYWWLVSNGSGNACRYQGITWTNVGTNVLWRHMASQGHSELSSGWIIHELNPHLPCCWCIVEAYLIDPRRRRWVRLWWSNAAPCLSPVTRDAGIDTSNRWHTYFEIHNLPVSSDQLWNARKMGKREYRDF